MRKVKYGVGVSVDGYIAAVDGSTDWLERGMRNAVGEDFGQAEFFQSIDTVVMGRKTYEVGLKAGMDPNGYPNLRNYVFSRTLKPGKRDGVEFVAGDPAKFVARLRRSKGKDIWLCGGGELAREFLRAGVLDEIILGVAPILIGAGRLTLPPEFPETELELTELIKFKGGVLGLTYRIVRAKTKRPRRPHQSGTTRRVRR